MKLNFDDIEMAFEFVSFDSYEEHSAYICLTTGNIIYDSEASEDEVPEDIYDEEKYLEIPSKRDLDLGQRLVHRFVSEFLPNDIERVYDIFRAKGAYSRYKALLQQRNALEKWYEYEESKQKEELLNWCKLYKVKVST